MHGHTASGLSAGKRKTSPGNGSKNHDLGTFRNHCFIMARASVTCFERAQRLRRQLCQNCRKVHLDDRSRGFIVAYKHGEPIGLEFVGDDHTKIPTEYLFTDNFPRLPKLEVSLRHGCRFCGYLREMILSKHTTEFTETHHGINTTDSEASGVEVTIRLTWILNTLFSGPNYLCANLEFSNRSSLILWSNVTAAKGTRKPVQIESPYFLTDWGSRKRELGRLVANSDCTRPNTFVSI